MKRTILMLAALAVLGLAAGQTLIYGVSGQPSSLDSVDSQDGNSLVVSNQITETLIGFAPGSVDLAPRLATSWSSNEEGDVWTFELREGVTFHDGTTFDAEAVKFNIDRWNESDHPYAFRDEGKTFVPWGWVFGGPRDQGGIVDEVVVIDANTVEIRTTQPSFLPNMLAAVYFQFDSPTAVMAHGADYGTPSVGSVGTGPFTFVEWVEGQQVTLAAYPEYWDGAPEVDEVVFRAISEPTARLAELQAGSIDIAILLSADDVETVASDPNLKDVSADVELNVGYLALHQDNEPFDNVLVRQAVAHAIDREAIVDAFFAGRGTVAGYHMPPAFAGEAFVGDYLAWPYDYDPERARELLAEAGFPDGFDTELWYMPVSRPYYPAPQPIAETMASYLAEVGIRAELLTEDWTTYLSDYQTGKFPMYMLGWNADYADPDNFLMTFFGPSAVTDLGWDAPEVVEMLNEARQTADPDERERLYGAVIAAVADQAASIPMAHNINLTAARSNIDGFVMSPLGYSSVPLHNVTKN